MKLYIINPKFYKLKSQFDKKRKLQTQILITNTLAIKKMEKL